MYTHTFLCTNKCTWRIGSTKPLRTYKEITMFHVFWNSLYSFIVCILNNVYIVGPLNWKQRNPHSWFDVILWLIDIWRKEQIGPNILDIIYRDLIYLYCGGSKMTQIIFSALPLSMIYYYFKYESYCKHTAELLYAFVYIHVTLNIYFQLSIRLLPFILQLSLNYIYITNYFLISLI